MAGPEQGLRGWVEASWYGDRARLLLLPLALLYGAVTAFRRALYRVHILRVARLPVPVLVVGNVTVGGTGKTPIVAAIVRRAHALGLRAGIVSRGYGGARQRHPQRVSAGSDPRLVGDEPVALARETGAPVCVCVCRAEAARALAREVDLIVADDGLQHYALGRDLEIAVVDARRGLGNGWLLPAGPLREPRWRLRTVDLVLRTGPEADSWLAPLAFRNVAEPTRQAPLSWLEGGEPVVAIAGIGDPERFFRSLRALAPTLALEARPYPDHHRYAAAELAPLVARRVVMTAKDAVKCQSFAGPDWWFLEVEARFAPAAQERIDAHLRALAVPGGTEP